jgi:anti-anti-sigma factor
VIDSLPRTPAALFDEGAARMAALAQALANPPRRFRVTSGGDGPDVLLLSGELDLAGASAMRAAMEDLVSAPRDRVVLDLSDLAFIDVGGARAIQRASERLVAEGATVTIRRPQPPVRRLLALFGLDGWTAGRARLTGTAASTPSLVVQRLQRVEARRPARGQHRREHPGDDR